MTERVESATDQEQPIPANTQPIVEGVQPPPKRLYLLDILSKIMGIVLPVVLYFATASFNHQQVALQSSEHRQSINEENRGRVMERLVNLGDDSSASARLAAAKALRSYAQMGRLDAVALPGLLPYLISECDQTVFRILKEAVLASAENIGHASESPAIPHPELLKGLDGIARSLECPAEALPKPPLTPSATVIAAPPQYRDVGCGETRTGILVVPLPAKLHPTQYVQSVSASFVNTDNLKTQSASVLQYDDTTARIQYSLGGLDRQLFGNCPGGGHGTIVTDFVIGVRDGRKSEGRKTGTDGK